MYTKQNLWNKKKKFYTSCF